MNEGMVMKWNLNRIMLILCIFLFLSESCAKETIRSSRFNTTDHTEGPRDELTTEDALPAMEFDWGPADLSYDKKIKIENYMRQYQKDYLVINGGDGLGNYASYNCINDGCFRRANMQGLWISENFDPQEVRVAGHINIYLRNPKEESSWGYHVAELLQFDNQPRRFRVMDSTIGTITMEKWINRFNDEYRSYTVNNVTKFLEWKVVITQNMGAGKGLDGVNEELFNLKTIGDIRKKVAETKPSPLAHQGTIKKGTAYKNAYQLALTRKKVAQKRKRYNDEVADGQLTDIKSKKTRWTQLGREALREAKESTKGLSSNQSLEALKTHFPQVLPIMGCAKAKDLPNNNSIRLTNDTSDLLRLPDDFKGADISGFILP